jgi:signal transduction histidine kinase
VTSARLPFFVLTGLGAIFLGYWVFGNVMQSQSVGGMLWDLIAYVPVYALGVWLSWRLPGNPQALRLLVAGTGWLAGSAFFTLLDNQPWIISSPWFPVLSTLSLEAEAMAVLAMAYLMAGYPDGPVERSWQRIALRCAWVGLLGPLLGLLASPVVPVSPWAAAGFGVSNPYALPSLSWAAEPALWYALNSFWAAVIVGIVVFFARFVAADAAQRARMRFLFVVLVLGLGFWAAVGLVRALGASEDSALVYVFSLLGAATGALFPIAIIHGILRHRVFDLDAVVRASIAYGAALLLIAAAYAVVAATPGLMLGNQVPVTLVVLITIAAALVFQPLRRRLESAVSRRLFGDRVRQYQLLKRLGTTMEQTSELDDLLPSLAKALRDGMGASWVQIRLHAADGGWLEPVGVAGQPTGDSAAGIDLVRAGEQVGRIDLGPKRGGYAAADLELLATVAGQATTAVANVRLATQLKEGLDELSRSRARLIAAQDAERRRIERDLHDGIQQEVVALIAGLRLARNRLSRNELTADELTDLQYQAREMLGELRELAHGIHPPVLTDNGLVAALESRVTRFPVPVEIIADDGLRDERFSEDVEGTAYFVACESLTNVAKHAGAEDAQVKLSRFYNLLCLAVEDSGRGFQPNGARSGGLANIRDRVEALHGRLTIESQVGAGTSIRAELPLRAASTGSASIT